MSSPIAPPGPGYTWNQTLNSGRGGWSAPTPTPAPTTTTPLSPLNTSNVQGTILPTDANYQSPTPLSPLNNMGTGSQPFNGTMYDTRNVQGTILPTDANYNELAATAIPFNPPKLYGQGSELPTNTGGSVVQMFGNPPPTTLDNFVPGNGPPPGMTWSETQGRWMPSDSVEGAMPDGAMPLPFNGTMYDTKSVQGTILPTDANYNELMATGMPSVTPPPMLYGQGPELPTNTGGTVVQMFGGRPPEMTRPPVPLPYERGVMPLAQPRAVNSLAARKLQRLQRQALRQNAPSPLSSLAPAPVKRLATAPQSGYRPIQNATLPKPRRRFAEGGEVVPEYAKGGSTTPAWQRSEGKNPEGGLNAAGRASYNRETGGNLKAPQPEGGSRKKSFCARMGGMKKKLTSSKTANDPDSRINKALRKWKC